MKAAKLLARLAAARDVVAELRRTGLALGDELAGRRLDELPALRAGLAGMKQAAGSFELGYQSALQDVMAAYEAAARRLTDEEDAQAVVLSEGWRDVLVALQAGAKRPADIAKATGKDPSWISRALQKLRDGMLVEISDGADGRTRPHRLTLLGQRVLARLPGPVSKDLRQGVQAAVHLDDRLASRGQLSLTEIAREAEAHAGDQQQAASVAQAWLEATTISGVAVCDVPVPQALRALDPGAGDQAAPAGGSVTWQRSPHAYARKLTALLHDVLRYGAPAPGWLERLRADVRDGAQLFIRTKHADAAWRLLLLEKLDCSRGAGSGRTITDGDLRSGALRSLEPGAARSIVIYDDAAVIRTDPLTHPVMRRIVDGAAERWCVSPDGEGLPAGFLHLPLHELRS